MIEPIAHLNAAPDGPNRVSRKVATAVVCVSEDPKPKLTAVAGQKRFLGRHEITAKPTIFTYPLALAVHGTRFKTAGESCNILM